MNTRLDRFSFLNLLLSLFPAFSLRVASTLLATFLATLFPALFPEVSLAQAVSPAIDGTGTQVNLSGNQFDITGGTQTGGNLFHSFQQFGLSQGQSANFLANPAIQNILGRVTGGNASVIDGLVKVTGGNANLYLMNPAGIVFGPNASLNVPGAFTATTANRIGFGNQWFNATGVNDYASLIGMPSDFAFTASQPGSIVNGGHLAVGQGQNLMLLGGTVVNTGTLSAPGGQVTVAAVPGGQQVSIQYGSLLTLQTRPIPLASDTASGNTAYSLPQLLTGGNLEEATGIQVNPDGSVELVGSKARVMPEAGLAVASGTLNVSSTVPSTTGGTVQVLGNKVAVANATINASGAKGGGTVLIGGDYQGKGTLPNAQYTYVSADSLIQADALTTGDGGKVVLWADGGTQFHGSISARGGAQSGNGGLVEVSGKNTLQFQGQVDTSAVNGAIGTILLDPRDITISNGSSSAGVDAALADGTIAFADFGSNDITISVVTLSNLAGNVSLQASRDITVLDDLTFTAGTSAQTVTFTAGRDIDLFGTLQTQGRSLILNAGGETVIRSFSNGITSNGGNITINSPLRVNAFTGNIDAGTGQVQLNGAVTSGNTLNLTGANLQVGAINVSNNLNLNGATTLMGGTIASTGGSISLNGPVTLTGDTTIDNGFVPNATLTINGSINGNQALTLIGGRNGLILNGDVGNTTPLASFSGSSSFSPTQLHGNITTNGGNLQVGGFAGSVILMNDITLSTGAGGGDITIRDGVNSDAIPRSLTVTAGLGNVIMAEAALGGTNPLSQVTVSGNDIQTNNIRTTGDVTLDALQNLTIASRQLLTGGNLNLLAGNTVLLQDGAIAGQELILDATGNLLIQGNQAVTIQASNNPLSRLQAGGDITVVSDGLITANARFFAGGNLSFLNSLSNPGTVLSDTQTLISSAGDVNFGNYQGLSLKVESLGSITGGNITITGPNATLTGTDPDIPLLVNSPALILQAGLASLQNLPNTPQAVGGTSFVTGGTATSPATISVGNIEVAADLSLGDTRIDGVILSAPGNIQAGNITTTGKSVTIASSNGHINAGDIATGGLGGALNSAVQLTAPTGNITVNTIDAGAGGVDVTAGGTFRAIGAKFFNGGTFQNEELIVGEHPALIEFLVNNIPGLTRESLAGSMTRIRVDTNNFPVSIITRPNNISDPNNARIVIRHGGESLPGSRIRVEGGGQNIQFVTGPKVTPTGNGFDLESGNLSGFNPALASQPFTLRRAETYQTLTVPGELPEGASGTVGGIVVGAGNNSNLYGVVRDRPFIPGKDVGTKSTNSTNNTNTSNVKGNTTTSTNVATQTGQEGLRSQNRGQLALCTPTNAVTTVAKDSSKNTDPPEAKVALAPNNFPIPRGSSPETPCTPTPEDAQILKILGEPTSAQPKSLNSQGIATPETLNPVEFQNR